MFRRPSVSAEGGTAAASDVYNRVPMLLAVGNGVLLGYIGRKWLAGWAIYADEMYLPSFAAPAANKGRYITAA